MLIERAVFDEPPLSISEDARRFISRSIAPRSIPPLINGLFESHRNRAPVVLIASQITTDEQGFDFPQEVDFAPIYKSCSVTDENSFYWT
jgi:hypothetical protein